MTIAFDVGHAMIHSFPSACWLICTCRVLPAIARTMLQLTGGSEVSVEANTVGRLSLGCLFADTCIVTDFSVFLGAVLDFFGVIVAHAVAFLKVAV